MDPTVALLLAVLAVCVTALLIARGRKPTVAEKAPAQGLTLPGGSVLVPSELLARISEEASQARADFRSDLEGLSTFFQANTKQVILSHERLIEISKELIDRANAQNAGLLSLLQTISLTPAQTPSGTVTAEGPSPDLQALEAERMNHERQLEDAFAQLPSELRQAVAADNMFAEMNGFPQVIPGMENSGVEEEQLP